MKTAYIDIQGVELEVEYTCKESEEEEGKIQHFDLYSIVVNDWKDGDMNILDLLRRENPLGEIEEMVKEQHNE